jgi:hypothetical protein
MSGKKSNQSLRMPTQVNSLWPNPQLLIALHSPNAPLETGLCMCLPEISQDNTAFDAEQSVLRSPVCLRIIAKYRHCSCISEQGERSFSAMQTAWRSGEDSNPRYRSETCKSRRLRKLRIINQFRNSPETACSPFDTLNSAVSRSF